MWDLWKTYVESSIILDSGGRFNSALIDHGIRVPQVQHLGESRLMTGAREQLQLREALCLRSQATHCIQTNFIWFVRRWSAGARPANHSSRFDVALRVSELKHYTRAWCAAAFFKVRRSIQRVDGLQADSGCELIQIFGMSSMRSYFPKPQPITA